MGQEHQHAPADDVADLVAAAVAAWATDDLFAPQTVVRMSEVARRFARRCATAGLRRTDEVDAGACRAFIDAPTRTGAAPTAATRHFRRTTLRAVFRTGRHLGLFDGDPTLDVDLPPRSGLGARPLTDDEVVLCRTATWTSRATDARRAAAWALAEATATTAEIPLLRRCDLTVTAVGWDVSLPGSRRVAPRTVALTDWGAAVITRRLAELDDDPDVPVVYGGSAAEGTTARHAAGCALVATVLSVCGLGGEPDVRPASVRHWRARRLFDAGARVEDVAVLLGHRSLDEAAAAVGHDWRAR
jgi:site-specific recombinase XerD